MSFGLIFAATLHLITAVAFGWFVLASYRWIRRHSTAIGAIVATTILLRAGAGLSLFWISYLRLPIAESLQMGDGFWRLFQDSDLYYRLAAQAADTGSFYSLQEVIKYPSPFFTNALALWMMAVGVSPAAGMFLNLCLYTALVLTVVRYFAPVNDWRRDRLCIAGVAAYSFSPVVLIHSTQPLKDELSAALCALACFGILGVRRLMYSPRTLQDFAALSAGTGAVALAVLGAGGTRWYYGAFIWCTLALVLAGFAIRGRTTSIPRYLLGAILVLVVVGYAFFAGAGPSADVLAVWRSTPQPSGAQTTPSVAGVIARIATTPFAWAQRLQAARTGFLSSGGGTNLVIALRNPPAAPAAVSPPPVAPATVSPLPPVGPAAVSPLPPVGPAAASPLPPAVSAAVPTPSPAAPVAPTQPPTTVPAAAQAQIARTADRPQYTSAIPRNARDVTKVMAFGLAVVFIPISVVRAVTGVEIPGGRGLLSVTDIDTVFQDVMIVLVILLLSKQRHALRDRLPFVVFTLVLSGLTAVLLGYAVTNFGTLWRMRSLIAVPLWVLAVAVSRREEPPNASSAPPAAAAC